jgi:hypothetical protein
MPIIYTHEWDEKPVCDGDNLDKCRKKVPNAYTTTFWTHTWE